MSTNYVRTGLRILLVTAMTSFTFSSTYGSGDVRFQISEDESSAAVLYSGNETVQFSLSIQDEAETMLYYSEGAKKLNRYSKRFNLASLNDGKYKLIAQLDGEKVVKPFEVIDSKVSLVNESSAKMDLTPEFKMIDNFLVCYYLNFSDEDVTLSFVSASDETFFVDEYKSGQLFHKKYNLENLSPGNYRVILSSGKENYTYNLSL